MAKALHLIARVRGFRAPLIEDEPAIWLWQHLMGAFPDAYSCVFMPDHLHLVVPLGKHDAQRCREMLRGMLSGFTRHFNDRFDIIIEVANSRATAARMVRYGYLNPVRAGLVVDPWMWPWSTLRDIGGAIYPAWTSLEHLAAALGRSPSGLVRGLTSSAEFSSPIPQIQPLQTAGVDAIQRAVAAACRVPFDSVLLQRTTRRLCVQASLEVRQVSATLVAEDLGLSRRTVTRLRTPPHPGMNAVALCLSDARLRQVVRRSSRIIVSHGFDMSGA